MKYITLSIFVLFTLYLNGQTFNADLSSAEANWTGYGEIGGFLQNGKISIQEASLLMNLGEIQNALVIFSTESITHENKELEKHLREKDFFFARKYPKITFELIKINAEKAKGKLEIRGISHEETIDLTVEHKGSVIIVNGKASIDRTKYDIKYNSSSYFQDLGNYAIKNKFDIDFKIKFKSVIK